MQAIFHRTSWLTPKEINLILRRYAMDQGHEQIKYTDFAEVLYNARFVLVQSRVMDTNLDKIGDAILNTCRREDKNGSGLVSVDFLRRCLCQAKSIVLTPF